jgi:two-component system chemotaxis response regulator CheY
MRTLVIDESRAVRLIILDILRAMGSEAIEAGDGREGLERLREDPDINLGLVDWNMPVMSGLEFVRAVRADRDFDAVRIMMVTTETETDQVIRAFEAGADEYVMKPFTREILIAKINLLDAFRES